VAKLTKAQTRDHERALALLAQDSLTFDEKWEVLEMFHEGATFMNGKAGAHFTPVGLARDFHIEVFGRRIIDLCAGIGNLSFMLAHSYWFVSRSTRPMWRSAGSCCRRRPGSSETSPIRRPSKAWGISIVPSVTRHSARLEASRRRGSQGPTSISRPSISRATLRTLASSCFRNSQRRFAIPGAVAMPNGTQS